MMTDPKEGAIMLIPLQTDSTTSCIDLAFGDSYISDNVIQGRFREERRGFAEDFEFLDTMRSIANQFDGALRTLAD